MAREMSTNVVLDYAPSEAGSYVIDLAKDLSLVNRKSFRQGYVYSVDYIEFIAGENSTLDVSKIPEGYTTHSSWKMGFEAWKEQRHAALEENDGAAPGKWSDFKVFINQLHQGGVWSELVPRGNNAAGSVLASGFSVAGSEWDHADLFYHDVGAATVSEVAIGMLGANDLANDYGALIQTWGDTRAGTVAPDPNVPGALSSSWMMRTGQESGDMSQDVLGKLETENDIPPYANEVDPANAPIYVGGSESVSGGVLHGSTVTGTTGRASSITGGLFPCGLLYLGIGGVTPPAGIFHVRVVLSRGKYKGVAALSMGDFN